MQWLFYQSHEIASRPAEKNKIIMVGRLELDQLRFSITRFVLDECELGMGGEFLEWMTSLILSNIPSPMELYGLRLVLG